MSALKNKPNILTKTIIFTKIFQNSNKNYFNITPKLF